MRLLPDVPYSTYDAYLQAVGASAVERARALAPEALVKMVADSGLRGRGGAGFPTGTKWATIARHACKTRFVVVNAAEGEPGTFKDRFLLRKNPYAMIEGMLIAAHAVSARRLFVAIKGSFTAEIARLKAALDEMAPLFEDLQLTVVEGPEEYLFGEEKALLNVIEGEGPLPRTADNPPYETGLYAKPGSPNPALVSNVETYSHVPEIVRHGAQAFRAVGTADTPGTILVTLSGDLARPGVYEVAAGTPLRKILDEQGGGPRPGRKYKALLCGVSTAPISAEQLDTPAEFGALRMIGAGLGSAGFIVIDDATSIPRVAQAAARFLYVESCNQCSACKAGLRVASTALDALFDPATAHPDDPDRAVFGAHSAPQANRCYLPVEGSLLIPQLVSRFSKEFQAQLADPAHAPAPFSLPKIVDYDEAAHQFRYDERQPLKQPDWTYRAPDEPARKQAAPRPRHAVSVRIAPDLAAALHERASEGGLELDRQIDLALREWLKKSRSASG